MGEKQKSQFGKKKKMDLNGEMKKKMYLNGEMKKKRGGGGEKKGEERIRWGRLLVMVMRGWLWVGWVDGGGKGRVVIWGRGGKIDNNNSSHNNKGLNFKESNKSNNLGNKMVLFTLYFLIILCFFVSLNLMITGFLTASVRTKVIGAFNVHKNVHNDAPPQVLIF